MWEICFYSSIVCLIIMVVAALSLCFDERLAGWRVNPFNVLLAGFFVSCTVAFLPINVGGSPTCFGDGVKAFFLSVFNSAQLFTLGCEFEVVKSGMECCNGNLVLPYQILMSVLFTIAPVFTFGFVLSLFKNLSAYLRYLFAFSRPVYVFSELNERSLALAADIHKKNSNAAFMFTDAFRNEDEKFYELEARARDLCAILFRKNLLSVKFGLHPNGARLLFFMIGSDESENLSQAIGIIEKYRERANTHIYVFSKKTESELLLNTVDSGLVRVRRINEIRAPISRILYERGSVLFKGAQDNGNGVKHISAVVVGMGLHGTEIVKALAWYGQMDGYSLEINAFDKDKLAEERLTALAPELMSPEYNGTTVKGEASYTIIVHSGIDVTTASFVKEFAKIKNATHIFVALGDDDLNIGTAVNVRMYCERMGIHPRISAMVYNSQKKKALCGTVNHKGQAYDIEPFGDVESSYTEEAVIKSELEADALKRHLGWDGAREEDFWRYEYNYSSSVASAIHAKARIECGIPGAEKSENELTDAEKRIIESLEHRRWNAYMRAEGYIYSGSDEKESRNDLGKMHNDLVDFTSLSDDEKRKDSRVGAAK